MFRRFLPMLPVFILLSACAPSREEADAKLADACLAAVQAVSGNNVEIFIDKKSFASDTAADHTKLRVVVLESRISVDKSAYSQRRFSCTFEENVSAFGLAYSARFYNLDLDNGMKYGNINGVVTGDFNDIARIAHAVDDVLLK